MATLHTLPQEPVFPARLHHHFDRHALHALDRFVVVAEQQKRDLVKWYGAPLGVFRVIPNGADAACFVRRASAVKREDLGLEAGDILVAHVGSVAPVRGQLVLAEALKRARGSCPRLRAVFVGDVIDPRYASALTAALNDVPDTPFRHLGYRRDATEILRLADIAVISSFQEGHSFALLEAMALGKAILATDVESNAESLAHGVAGLLVPRGDAAVMAEGLGRLCSDPNLRTRLGEAARLRAERHYTEARTIRETICLYRTLRDAQG
jgi:glycosyltransferase involved in cell wall biosynthesis